MERPSLTHTITINDEPREIKMVFSLLQDILKIVGGLENIEALILSDPFMRDFVVARALTPGKGSKLKPEELVDLDEIDLDYQDIVSLIAWISAHIVFFTVASAKSLEPLKDQIEVPSNP